MNHREHSVQLPRTFKNSPFKYLNISPPLQYLSNMFEFQLQSRPPGKTPNPNKTSSVDQNIRLAVLAEEGQRQMFNIVKRNRRKRQLARRKNLLRLEGFRPTLRTSQEQRENPQKKEQHELRKAYLQQYQAYLRLMPPYKVDIRNWMGEEKFKALEAAKHLKLTGKKKLVKGPVDELLFEIPIPLGDNYLTQCHWREYAYCTYVNRQVIRNRCVEFKLEVEMAEKLCSMNPKQWKKHMALQARIQRNKEGLRRMRRENRMRFRKDDAMALTFFDQRNKEMSEFIRSGVMNKNNFEFEGRWDRMHPGVERRLELTREQLHIILVQHINSDCVEVMEKVLQFVVMEIQLDEEVMEALQEKTADWVDAGEENAWGDENCLEARERDENGLEEEIEWEVLQKQQEIQKGMVEVAVEGEIRHDQPAEQKKEEPAEVLELETKEHDRFTNEEKLRLKQRLEAQLRARLQQVNAATSLSQKYRTNTLKMTQRRIQQITSNQMIFNMLLDRERTFRQKLHSFDPLKHNVINGTAQREGPFISNPLHNNRLISITGGSVFYVDYDLDNDDDRFVESNDDDHINKNRFQRFIDNEDKTNAEIARELRLNHNQYQKVRINMIHQSIMAQRRSPKPSCQHEHLQEVKDILAHDVFRVVKRMVRRMFYSKISEYDSEESNVRQACIPSDGNAEWAYVQRINNKYRRNGRAKKDKDEKEKVERKRKKGWFPESQLSKMPDEVERFFVYLFLNRGVAFGASQPKSIAEIKVSIYRDVLGMEDSMVVSKKKGGRKVETYAQAKKAMKSSKDSSDYISGHLDEIIKNHPEALKYETQQRRQRVAMNQKEKKMRMKETYYKMGYYYKQSCKRCGQNSYRKSFSPAEILFWEDSNKKSVSSFTKRENSRQVDCTPHVCHDEQAGGYDYLLGEISRVEMESGVVWERAEMPWVKYAEMVPIGKEREDVGDDEGYPDQDFDDENNGQFHYDSQEDYLEKEEIEQLNPERQQPTIVEIKIHSNIRSSIRQSSLSRLNESQLIKKRLGLNSFQQDDREFEEAKARDKQRMVSRKDVLEWSSFRLEGEISRQEPSSFLQPSLNADPFERLNDFLKSRSKIRQQGNREQVLVKCDKQYSKAVEVGSHLRNELMPLKTTVAVKVEGLQRLHETLGIPSAPRAVQNVPARQKRKGMVLITEEEKEEKEERRENGSQFTFQYCSPHNRSHSRISINKEDFSQLKQSQYQQLQQQQKRIQQILRISNKQISKNPVKAFNQQFFSFLDILKQDLINRQSNIEHTLPRYLKSLEYRLKHGCMSTPDIEQKANNFLEIINNHMSRVPEDYPAQVEELRDRLVGNFADRQMQAKSFLSRLEYCSKTRKMVIKGDIRMDRNTVLKLMQESIQKKQPYLIEKCIENQQIDCFEKIDNMLEDFNLDHHYLKKTFDRCLMTRRDLEFYQPSSSIFYFARKSNTMKVNQFGLYFSVLESLIKIMNEAKYRKDLMYNIGRVYNVGFPEAEKKEISAAEFENFRKYFEKKYNLCAYTEHLWEYKERENEKIHDYNQSKIEREKLKKDIRSFEEKFSARFYDTQNNRWRRGRRPMNTSLVTKKQKMTKKKENQGNGNTQVMKAGEIWKQKQLPIKEKQPKIIFVGESQKKKRAHLDDDEYYEDSAEEDEEPVDGSDPEQQQENNENQMRQNKDFTFGQERRDKVLILPKQKEMEEFKEAKYFRKRNGRRR